MGIEQQIVLFNVYSHIDQLWVIKQYIRIDGFPPCLSAVSPQLWSKCSQNMRIHCKMLWEKNCFCRKEKGIQSPRQYEFSLVGRSPSLLGKDAY